MSTAKREAYKKYYEANKEKERERSRVYCQKNRQRKIDRAKERIKEDPTKSSHLRNPEAHFRIRLKHRYGLTLEDYNQMHAERAGVCEICNEVYSKTLHIDHCHKSGKVRGLLCPPCNKGIGHLKDDPEILRRAIVYLERNNVRYRTEPPG